MATGDKPAKARKTNRKDESQTQQKRAPKAKRDASKGDAPSKPRATKTKTKPANADKKRKVDELDEAQGAAKPATQTKQHEEKLVIDDNKLVGQYTRARRFAMQCLEEFGEGLIPTNGEVGEFVPVPEGSKIVPATQLRFSKGAIQLLRWIAQNLCLLNFEKYAVMLKLTGRQTLCHDTVHALRFIQYGTDNTIANVNRRPIKQLCMEVVHDYANGKTSERMGNKDWESVTKTLAFIGAETPDDYKELVGGEIFELNHRAIEAPPKKKQKQIAN